LPKLHELPNESGIYQPTAVGLSVHVATRTFKRPVEQGSPQPFLAKTFCQ